MIRFIEETKAALEELLDRKADLPETIRRLIGVCEGAIEAATLESEYSYADFDTKLQTLGGVDDREHVSEVGIQRRYVVDACLPTAKSGEGDEAKRLFVVIEKRLGRLPSVGLVLPRAGTQKTFFGEDSFRLTAKALNLEQSGGYRAVPEAFTQ